MADRRPLIIKDGRIEEMPSGDTVSATIAPGAGGLTNKFDATAAPAVGNDNTEGYAVGSRWVDVTNDNSYTCVDASTGAAVWVQENGAGGSGLQDNLVATAAPTTGNDNTEGYAVGSKWINVTADTAYICVDSSTGAAVWKQIDAGGGAANFLALSDTPGSFGTVGQMLAVNSATDALEFVDAPSAGDATYIVENALYSNNIASIAFSSSAYAAKGNIYTVTESRFLTELRAKFSASQTVKAVIAEVSEVNPGTITSILMDSPEVVVGASERLVDFQVDNIEFETGKFYAIIFVRTDGTATAALSIPFETNVGYSDRYNYFEYEASIRYESNNPSVSDTTFYNSTSSISFQLNTVGSDLFSTVRMTQTEITASRNLTEDDLKGNVIRRVKNASAITITVAPGLTNKQPVTFIQTDVGQVIFAEGAGVTIESTDNNLKLRTKTSSGTLIPDVDTANLYYLIGDLTA